jgi:hypothetical protein
MLNGSISVDVNPDMIFGVNAAIYGCLVNSATSLTTNLLLEFVL